MRMDDYSARHHERRQGGLPHQPHVARLRIQPNVNRGRPRKTNATRRDLLRLAGGAAAGVMLSPVPWKL
ncbi:MAG TPA: hypothetical protein VMT19_13530, partial [Thermoanaerobaculaceae bacterium]|nr:hypothetical protein [Thermoanaerobaculaceae bacterium]